MGGLALFLGKHFCAVAVRSVITLCNPDSKNYTLFGEYTYVFLYIGTFSSTDRNICGIYSQRLKLPMQEYIAKSWVSQIKGYLERIQALLLEYNENEGKKGREKL